MSTNDQKFFDVFIIVIGLLVAFAIAMIILARAIASETQLKWVRENPELLEAVDARLQPAGMAALPGEEAGAAAPAAGEVASTAAPVAAPLSGPQVFNQACNACHGAGIAGAPKSGDKAAWSARIAQGTATLYKHSIEGFTGKSGVMPPKGGWTNLSDGEIKAAVDYMVAESR